MRGPSEIVSNPCQMINCLFPRAASPVAVFARICGLILEYVLLTLDEWIASDFIIVTILAIQ